MMDLIRISELDKLISNLFGFLESLKKRRNSLELEAPGAKGAQERLEAVATSAKYRIDALSGFGFRAEFLEEIIQPVRKVPDCSGVGTVVANEISGIDKQIWDTQTRMGAAEQEKKQLEMEDVWKQQV